MKSGKPTANEGRIVMVTVMGIEKHAAFYRGYQPDDRSLFPVAIALGTIVGLWLLVYLLSAVGPQQDSGGGEVAAPVRRRHPTGKSLIGGGFAGRLARCAGPVQAKQARRDETDAQALEEVCLRS